MSEEREAMGSAIARAVDTGLTAATTAAGVPGGPIVTKVAAQLLHAAAGLVQKRNTQKFENWLQEVAAGLEHASPDVTIRLIEESIDKTWAHGPLEDAVRAIRDGIDEAALSYLARLAAWQIRNQVPPDRWSRRAVGLLLDCDAQMVAALVHLTEHLPTRWPTASEDMVRIAVGGPIAVSFGVVQISSTTSQITYVPNHENSWKPHPLYAELFALLRAHQFATEESGRFAHEGKMLMGRHEAVYLVRLFLGAAAAAHFPGAK